MIGIVPIDRADHRHDLASQMTYDIKYTEYKKTNDVDLLMHPEAILLDEDADSSEYIISALKERYPDIEPGYGQVYDTGYSYAVYDQPGITTKDHTQIEAICRNHGKVRIFYTYYVPPKDSALVCSVKDGFIYVRYDEKIRKRRINKTKEKAEKPKRNLQFLQEIVKKLLNGIPEQEILLSKLLQKHSNIHNSNQIAFDHTYTVHQRNRMLLEIFLLTRVIDPKPSSENVTTYHEAKELWLKAVPDPKLTNEDSVAVIKMLNDFFQVGNG